VIVFNVKTAITPTNLNNELRSKTFDHHTLSKLKSLSSIIVVLHL
jgi:hypothetical protein